MKIPPNIGSTARIKKTPEERRTFTRGVRWVKTNPVNRTVKDRVKVAGKNSRHRGINLRMKIIQELIPSRVAIGSINRTNPKRLMKKRKLTLKVTAINITPRVN